MYKTAEKAAQAVFVLILLSNLVIGQTFQHNFEDAKKLAAETNRPIALVFSGSDWCKPCIQLRTTVLEDSSFVDFADKNLVLVEVDFPYKKANRLSKEQQAHNEKLAEQYNKQGAFPLVVLADAAGKVKGELGYDQRLPVDGYIQKIEKMIGGEASIVKTDATVSDSK
jgi:thioredoxin-related protein